MTLAGPQVDLVQGVAVGGLHAAVTLGGPKDILFVSFNSLKRPFNGLEARWEFYELPLKRGIDHVRFAERAPPDMWYLDKTRPIFSMLNGVIAQGYRLVVMCGLSSGGYASLLFTELLAPLFPRTLFKSFSINPQTTHGAAALAVMADMAQGYPPALIAAENMARRDRPETDIRVIAQTSPFRENLEHRIFYDPLNPAEAYYVRHLDGLAGIALRPVPMGVGHLSACIEIFGRRVLHDELDAVCRDFL